MAAPPLRQRRRRPDGADAIAIDDEEREMQIFMRQYGRAAADGRRRLAAMCREAALLVIAVLVASTASSLWRSRGGGTGREDLVLLTVYPRSVSSRIHSIEGQTELLVTKENREAVEAVRTAITMANDLRYDGSRGKRRRGGVAGALLGVSNFIANFGSGQKEEGGAAGEIVLKSFDEAKMREYLLEHGERCSRGKQKGVVDEEVAGGSAGNAALHQHDRLLAQMTTEHEGESSDWLWSRAVHLFAWCQLANGDARGYIAHGTSIGRTDSGSGRGLPAMLEEARSTGSGIAVRQSRHPSMAPPFVVPRGIASRDMAGAALQSQLSEDGGTFPPSSLHSDPLLLQIDKRWRKATNNARQGEGMRGSTTEGGGGAGWLFLETVVSEGGSSSDMRWLARRCRHDGRCLYVIDTRVE